VMDRQFLPLKTHPTYNSEMNPGARDGQSVPTSKKTPNVFLGDEPRCS
jgi:hypothetical protein